MHETLKIVKSRPILVGSLSLLVLLICSYHFLKKIGLDLSVFVALVTIIVFLSLVKETKSFLFDSIKHPKKYFLTLCILIFGFAGIIFDYGNIIEIGLTIILFFTIYLIFKNQDKNLNNFIANLMVASGAFMSIGVVIGFFESMFLSSEFFYHIFDGYAYIDQKVTYSGFGTNHNFSAYIVIVAQSFLFLSRSRFVKNLRTYLTALFVITLLITGAKIAFLFLSLVVCNQFFDDKIKKNLINVLLITSYLFASHIVVAFHGSYELGSLHYRELLFSIGNIDIVLNNYAHLKTAYFMELKENFFLPLNLMNVTQAMNADPHSLIYSLIIIGSLPLAISMVAFIGLGICKNFRIIENRYPSYFFCGLISIITETFLWDANNSIFFWIIILYAINISKDSLPNENSLSISANE